MKTNIILDLPEPLRRRMSQIRAQRGTAAAHRYAHAALTHLRTAANAQYMRRHVGAPSLLALRALLYHTVLVIPVAYFVASGFGPTVFLASLPIVGIYILAQALSAYLDGGRHD